MYLIAMVTFTIMTILIVLVKDNLITIASLFLFIVFYILLFNFQKKYYKKTDIEQIQYVNHQSTASLSALLEPMPVEYVKLNMDSSEIEWFNPYYELILITEA